MVAPASAEQAASDEASSVDAPWEATRPADVQEVLRHIFEYYSIPTSSSETRVLTSARFNKLLLDSSVIDERLPNAKADLVFAKVCGHASNPMSCKNFLDAVVQLAKQKFPGMPRVQGVMKLHHEHFAAFSIATEEPMGGLAPDVVEVLAEARPGLQALYRIYFQDCLAPGTLPPNFHAQAQEAWVQFLSDYEVLPEFAAKPMVFAAFREVSQLKALPQHTRDQILGEEQDMGRIFTFVHFGLALVALARRCFADFNASSMLRLFHWMDESKGHVLASSRGSVSPNVLRIFGSPDLHRSLAALDAGSRRASSRGSVAGRQSLSVGALRRSVGMRASVMGYSTGGSSPSESQRKSTSSTSASAAMAYAAQFTADALGASQSLSSSARVEAMLQEVFTHYAGLGDASSQSHLTLLSFRQFLKDCGLVSSEGGRSDFHEFVPAERVQMARKSLGGSLSSSGGSGNGSPSSPSSAVPAALRRASSVGGTQRASRKGSCARASQVGGIGGSAPRRSLVPASLVSKELPLQVYPRPPLTPVDADLIFVQAIQCIESSPDLSRGSARRRSSSQAGNSPGSERNGQRTRMTLAAFTYAVQTVAAAVYQGQDEAEMGQVLDDFGNAVIEPLSKVLFGDRQQEVQVAAEWLASDDASIFVRSRQGLERIFTHYARTSQSQKPTQPYWTAEDMAKFIRDFGLAAEVSQRPSQQIFRSCASFERLDVKVMNFWAFQLAVVIIAQKIHSTFKYSPSDKVALLFHRLNTVAREEGHFGPKPANNGLLIPGLPPLAALAVQEGGPALIAALRAPGTPSATAAAAVRRQSGLVVAKSPQEAESWVDVLEDEVY